MRETKNRTVEKTEKNVKKCLHFKKRWFIIALAVTLIALKREVAARRLQVFPWSECQVRKLATSHCTI